jgi:outer membrane protein TolC
MDRFVSRTLLSFGFGFGMAALLTSPSAVAQTPPAPPPASAPHAAPPPSDAASAGGGEVVYATPGGLVSDEVARRASANSFDALAQQKALLAASAKVDQALVAYVPKLSLTARYTRLSPITPPVFDLSTIFPGAPPVNLFPIYLNNYLFQATLAVPVSDYLLRTSQAYQSARRSEKAAALNEQAARLKAATDGRVAYYAWVRSRGQYLIAVQTLEQAKGHLTDARHAFEVGTVSKADVLGAEAQVAAAELLVEQSRNLASLTEEQMRVAMADESGRPYEVGEDQRQEPAPLKDADNIEALRAEAMTRRPEVRALEETVGSLREQAKSVKAGYWPRLDAFGDLIYANPNQRYVPADGLYHATWDVGVQVTWSPNDTWATSGGAAEIEAHAAQTEAQKAGLRLAIRVEVQQAYQALKEARVAIETTARQLAAAEEAYRVRRELYKNGRATSVELTDAETQLFQARLASINSRTDVRIAQARLVHATGRDAGGT